MKLDYLQALLNFKSYFSTKYGYFRLDEMWKKYINMAICEEKFFYVKKCLKFGSDEILIRLNNAVIQLHFKDLTGIMTESMDIEEMYYMDEKGRTEKMKEKVKDWCRKKKKKGKKFRSIVEKLSGRKEKVISESSSSSSGSSEELLIL